MKEIILHGVTNENAERFADLFLQESEGYEFYSLYQSHFYKLTKKNLVEYFTDEEIWFRFPKTISVYKKDEKEYLQNEYRKTIRKAVARYDRLHKK